jgi:hypothetical protein
MLQPSPSKTSIRVAARPRQRTLIAPRRAASTTPSHPNAAPLTLAAVVIGGELLAVAMVIVSAVGA